MTHTQRPDFVFRWNGRVHLNRRERQFCRLRLLVAEVCASAVVMLDTPCSEVVWRVSPVRNRVPSHLNWTLQMSARRWFQSGDPLAAKVSWEQFLLRRWETERRCCFFFPSGTQSTASQLLMCLFVLGHQPPKFFLQSRVSKLVVVGWHARAGDGLFCKMVCWWDVLFFCDVTPSELVRGWFQHVWGMRRFCP